LANLHIVRVFGFNAQSDTSRNADTRRDTGADTSRHANSSSDTDSPGLLRFRERQ
jgi:hypothetical protein